MRLPRHQSIAQRIREEHAPPVAPEDEKKAEVASVRIQIPKPLPHQDPIVADDAPYKVLQAGRRGGKTRVDFFCATLGHGSLINDVDGEGKAITRPRHRGILTSNLDVVWICPTYRQANPLWNEEIRPRFADRPHCHVNDSEHEISVEGLGRLFVRTWDNAGSIRGQGKRLVGAIFDEAAHMDTQSIWADIVLPALMDNDGWAIFSSTTNSGLDGNKEQLTPSWFNRLCHELDQGKREKHWRKWYFTAFDNPKIKAHVIEKTIDEILKTKGQRGVDEEIYAKLLEGGTGLAFPTWRKNVHVRDIEDLEGWGCIGTLDWGSTHPGAFYNLLQGPGGQLHLRNELFFNGEPRQEWPVRLPAALVGRKVAVKMLAFFRKHQIIPEYIAADAAMWSITGVGQTLASKFQEGIDEVFADVEQNEWELSPPQLIPAPKGPGSRQTRKELLTEALHWEEDAKRPGHATVEGPPLLAVGTDCPYFALEVAVLPNDLLDSEKAADVNNDCYDSATYGLHALLPEYDGDVARARAHERERSKIDSLSRKEAEQYDQMVRRAQKPRRRRAE